uniref:ATP synthase complex subunit 8 n=1 Tax=Allobates amissibilis TaxID=2739727 RepID=A0A7M4CGD7_9NEOB|nr:ATP synthase F0 subunit 8 [Allobates amissibilis]
MPQLSPQPWFLILLSTWLVLLFFATMKTSKFTFLSNAPDLTFNALNTLNTPWSWPWL